MTYVITSPSIHYARWKDQPCSVVNIMLGDDYCPRGYVDVVLTGNLDRGLRLRIMATAVKQVHIA